MGQKITLTQPEIKAALTALNAFLPFFAQQTDNVATEKELQTVLDAIATAETPTAAAATPVKNSS